MDGLFADAAWPASWGGAEGGPVCAHWPQKSLLFIFLTSKTVPVARAQMSIQPASEGKLILMLKDCCICS